ncbi:MAG: prepilin-type N-terminal cleavage/methylation domain-containing protein [Thermodesulfobacterium sp.]|nr:prepilin-type N-terminal cleavage/methylation domain-containing protein [Thermodesulfobacterium sp.]
MNRFSNLRNLGFTLLELILVMAIISILSALAIPIYIRYQQKSKVASYALPMVRACANEAITYCMSERAADVSNLTLNVTSFPNCRNATTPVGNLTVNITGSVTCEETGHVSNCTVFGELEGVNLYQAKCDLRDQSLHCEVIYKNS